METIEEMEAKSKVDNAELRKLEQESKELEIQVGKYDVQLDHHLEILNEGFLHRSAPQTADEDEGVYNQIVLRFPQEMAYRVYDEFDKAQIQQQADGAFIVSAKMPEDAWLTGFLLSFGTQVDILSPVYLKEVIAEQAKRIYEKNKP